MVFSFGPFSTADATKRVPPALEMTENRSVVAFLEGHALSWPGRREPKEKTNSVAYQAAQFVHATISFPMGGGSISRTNIPWSIIVVGPMHGGRL